MAIISQRPRQFMPGGDATSNPTHHLPQRREAQEKNRWKALRNVSGFRVVLKHSSLQEILNEHQSKENEGPHSELEPSSSLSAEPHRGGWLSGVT